MSEEPNSRNQHDQPQQEVEADPALPPEVAALTARLTTDGVLWQSRLPDAARVAERIRAIAHEPSPDAAEAGSLTSTNISSPPDGGRRAPRPDDRRRAPSGPWGRFIGLAAAVVVVALFATVLLRLATLNNSTGPVAHPTPTQLAPTATNPSLTATPTPSPVLVYFSKNPESLNDPTAVFPLQRVAPNSAVATYAIQQLIAGPTLEERGAGYFSELNSLFTGPSTCSNGSNPTGGPDFTLTLNKKGSTTEQGTATLQFCRPTSSPGVGADARVTAEITKALTQFSTITKVVILLRNGHCFGDESGLDRCLK
jgi:hypothetical protein